MYCVEWKTRNAKPAKKSRDDNKPATGRNVNPVQSNQMKSIKAECYGTYGRINKPFKKFETSSNCGILSSRYPQLSISNGKT